MLRGDPSPRSLLPVQLSRNLTPTRFRLLLQSGSPLYSDEALKLLDEWFLGKSLELVSFLLDRVGELEGSVFIKRFLEESVEILISYFHSNLKRHRIIRKTYLDGNQLIEQDQLDDLITIFNSTQTDTTFNLQ